MKGRHMRNDGRRLKKTVRYKGASPLNQYSHFVVYRFQIGRWWWKM